jgi:hypothetical protein
MILSRTHQILAVTNSSIPVLALAFCSCTSSVYWHTPQNASRAQNTTLTTYTPVQIDEIDGERFTANPYWASRGRVEVVLPPGSHRIKWHCSQALPNTRVISPCMFYWSELKVVEGEDELDAKAGSNVEFTGTSKFLFGYQCNEVSLAGKPAQPVETNSTKHCALWTPRGRGAGNGMYEPIWPVHFLKDDVCSNLSQYALPVSDGGCLINRTLQQSHFDDSLNDPSERPIHLPCTSPVCGL